MKNYLIIILLFFSGCQWITGAALPPFALLGIPEPEGTPIFKSGFKDGCESILHNRGTGLFRDRYKYHYDTTLMDNPEYQFGFSRGWTNCFNHVVSGRHTLGGSADTYIYGNGVPFGMGTGNINDTFSYGGGWDNPFAAAGSTGDSIESIWGVVHSGNKGGGGTAFGGHPLWGTLQDKQIFGQ